MKLRRILAASVAAAIATSAMAIVSFADASVANSGSVTVKSTGGWWDQSDISMADLLGDVDPATVTKIVVTTDNAAAIQWNNPEYQKVDLAAGGTLEITDAVLDAEFYFVSFAVSSGDTSYSATINWDVYADAASAPATPETTTPEDTATDAPAEVDWSAYKAEDAKAANEAFTLGGNIDLYAALGDNWNKLAKIDATFVWNPEFGWCGGAGIGGGATLADGTNWIAGAEYGCANANADLQAAGTATQTIIDITATPLATIAGVTDDGVSEFGVLMVQNWWNGTEAGAAVKALTFYDAEGNVLAEYTYDVETPWASTEGTTTPEDTTGTEAGKGSSDTGVEGIAAVAGVAALAGAAVVIARKRK